MIIKRSFRWKEDDDYGIWGWQPVGLENVNSFESKAAGHDVIEHLPWSPIRRKGRTVQIGRLEDELMALGASHYIRGETGWYYDAYPHNVNRPHHHLGSSVYHDIMRPMQYGEAWLGDPGVTKGAGDGDEELREAMAYAMKLWHGEETDTETLAPPHGQRLAMLRFMRIGYNRAARTFPNATQARFLYDRIGEAVARHEPPEQEWPYDWEITVSVDTRKGTVRVTQPEELEGY